MFLGIGLGVNRPSSLAWHQTSSYSAMAAVADFNNDRYALPAWGSELVTNGTFGSGDVLSAEMVTNGGFDADTNWTKGTGWTIGAGSGVATKTAGTLSNLSQNVGLVATKTYLVTATVTRTAGVVSVYVGISTLAGSISASGTYSYYATAAGDTTLYFQGDAAFAGTIDNVSVKEVTNATTDTTGWTVGNSASLISAAGNLRVTDNGVRNPYGYQAITTVSGRLYYITATQVGVSGSLGQITVGTSIAGSQLGSVATAGGSRSIAFAFTATGTTTYISAFAWTSTTGQYAEYDAVSVKEVILTPTGRTYGSELLDNGDFSAAAVADASLGWVVKSPAVGTETMTVNSGGSGVLALTGDGTNPAYADQSFTTTNGQVYEITFTIATNSCDVLLGKTQGGFDYSALTLAAGTHTYKFASTGTTGWIRFRRTTAGLSTIDNVTIKALTAVGSYPKRTATFDECFAYTAASDSARTYTDSTGVLRDMRYGRHNFVLQSQTLNNASWTLVNGGGTVTISADATTAPDGTTTADKIVEAADTGFHDASQTVAMANGPMTFSAYFKAAERTKFTIRTSDLTTGGYNGNFDLTAGTATIDGTAGSWSGATTSITAVGNGWYRCSLTATKGAGASVAFAVGLLDNAGTRSYLGVAASGGFVWGAQLELGSVLSAYNATTTAAYAGGVNARRLTYANGKRQLRLENAGTNLVLRSQEFDSASWTKDNGTITVDQAVAPDGTTTADLFTNNTVNGLHRVYWDNVSNFAAGPTLSVFAKAGTASFISLTPSGTNAAYATFNLATGAVAASAGGTGSIVALGNGWYRCIFSATATNRYIVISMGETQAQAEAGASYIGTTKTVYLWGAQAEANAFATDYIATTTAAVTRAIETARLSPLLEAVLQRAQGSVVVRGRDVKQDNGRVVGTDGTSALIYRDGTFGRSINGASILSTSPGSGGWTTDFGLAMGFDAAGRSLGFNGSAIVSDAIAAPTRTTLHLARDQTGTYANAFYDLLGIPAERLPNTTLQALAVAAT